MVATAAATPDRLAVIRLTPGRFYSVWVFAAATAALARFATGTPAECLGFSTAGGEVSFTVQAKLGWVSAVRLEQMAVAISAKIAHPREGLEESLRDADPEIRAAVGWLVGNLAASVRNLAGYAYHFGAAEGENMATYAARLFYAVLKQDVLPVIPPYDTRPVGFLTVLKQWVAPLEYLMDKEHEKVEAERRKKHEADLKALQQQMQKASGGGGGGGAATQGTKRTHDGAVKAEGGGGGAAAPPPTGGGPPPPRCLLNATERARVLQAGQCPNHMDKPYTHPTKGVVCTGVRATCKSTHTHYGGAFSGLYGTLDVSTSSTFVWLTKLIPGVQLMLPADGQSAMSANPAVTTAQWEICDRTIKAYSDAGPKRE